jgi:hypothetical protein
MSNVTQVTIANTDQVRNVLEFLKSAGPTAMVVISEKRQECRRRAIQNLDSMTSVFVHEDRERDRQCAERRADPVAPA